MDCTVIQVRVKRQCCKTNKKRRQISSGCFSLVSLSETTVRLRE